MTDLDTDQEDQLTKWIQQNGNPLGSDSIQKTNDAANLTALNVPRGTNSPTPKTPATPQMAPTDTGSPEDETDATDNDQRIKEANPGHAPTDLNGATPLGTEINKEIGSVNEYGPEQEKAVLQNILKNQGSFQNRASRGLAGLGDAIMGVAGKSSPGFLENRDKREEAANKMAADTIPTLAKLNTENLGVKKGLEEETNTTPRGQAKAQAYQAVFKKFFPQMSPKELNAISTNPEVAEKIFPGVGAIVEKQLQMEIQKENLDVNKQRLTQEGSNQQTQRVLDAQKQLESLGVIGRALPQNKALVDSLNKIVQEGSMGGTGASGWKYLGKVK